MKKDEITANGSLVDDSIPLMAFISLKTALQSYFGTYQAVSRQWNDAVSEQPNGEHQSQRYIENYCETILHFQHFAELTCKHILRQDNELLPIASTKNHKLLYKLIKQEPITEDEKSNINTVEFAEALNILSAALDFSSFTKRSDYLFVKEHKDPLFTLNTLRNRAVHRGVFVLNYAALDKFICGEILPFVKSMVASPYFRNNESRWQHSTIGNAGIKVIDSLIGEISDAQTPRLEKYKRIALLKEMGRAAYNNKKIGGVYKETPISVMIERVNREKIARLEAAAEFASDPETRIEICPICQTQSLILNLEDETPFAVACECCTFSLTNQIDVLSKCTAYGVRDFWL